jgi:hypothetical protein
LAAYFAAVVLTMNVHAVPPGTPGLARATGQDPRLPQGVP